MLHTVWIVKKENITQLIPSTWQTTVKQKKLIAEIYSLKTTEESLGTWKNKQTHILQLWGHSHNSNINNDADKITFPHLTEI